MAFRWRALVNWLVGQSVLLSLPVENWTMLSFIVAMTSFVVVWWASRQGKPSIAKRAKQATVALY
jgi:hypothetical protein